MLWIAISSAQGWNLSLPPRTPKINCKFSANEHDRDEIQLKTTLQTSLKKTLPGVNSLSRCFRASSWEALHYEDAKPRNSKPCPPRSYSLAMEEAGNAVICGDKEEMKTYEPQRSVSSIKLPEGWGGRWDCGVGFIHNSGRRETMSVGNQRASRAIVAGRTEEKRKTRKAVSSLCSWSLESYPVWLSRWVCRGCHGLCLAAHMCEWFHASTYMCQHIHVSDTMPAFYFPS